MTRVTIVARNGQTLDELQRYLDETGVGADASSAAEPARVDASSSAVVLFPDDFDPNAARAFVVALRASRPELLIVVVTREPHGLASATAPDGRSLPPVVLPRPSFGWAILDAIRAHVPSSPSEGP